MHRVFVFAMRSNIRLFYIVISIIVITLVMIALLGNAIGNVIETGVYSVEKVAVVNRLEAGYKEELDKLFATDGLDKVMEITYLDNVSDVDQLLEDEVYHTVLVGEISDGKNNLHVHTVYSESYVLSLASSFTQTANTLGLIIEKSPQSMDNALNTYGDEVIKTIALPKGSPDGVDYYGIQTMLQMSSLLCLISIYTVLDDKTKNIHPRISTIPISKTKVIVARASADILFVWIVMIIQAVSSHFILGANWSGNHIVILAVLLIFAVIVVLLGMISAKLTGTVIGALGLSMGFGTVIWPRLSGAFSPYQRKVGFSFTSPSFNAKNVLFATIYSDTWSVITKGLINMSIIAIVMIVIYIFVEKRSTKI